MKIVNKMYNKLDNGAVSPNGANHSPRRFASRKWCVVNAINNMLIHSTYEEFFEEIVKYINTKRSVAGIVELCRNGLLFKFVAS